MSQSSYQERFERGQSQKQLSKEFVREWLMSHGFQGKPGQQVPEMADDFINEVSERYIELFEKITGDQFFRADISNVETRIEKNVNEFLKEYR